MNKISKVLIASALTLTFAAPAFAGEEATLQERNVYTNPQGPRAQAFDGTDAFAFSRTPDRMQRNTVTVSPAYDWSNARDQGIKSQR